MSEKEKSEFGNQTFKRNFSKKGQKSFLTGKREKI